MITLSRDGFITLSSTGSLSVTLCKVGARLVSAEMPDRTGRVENVILGLSKPESYLSDTAYLGATIGRYANRIKDGRFVLDNETYRLVTNDNGNCLHGGAAGFDKAMWRPEFPHSRFGSCVVFRLVSPDGDQGFPGRLEVSIRYTLLPPSGLRLDYV